MSPYYPDGTKAAVFQPAPASTPTAPPILQNAYVNVGGGLLATQDPTGNYHLQLTDWLGNRRMQTDPNGNEEAQYWNRPFGDTDQPLNTGDPTTEHFTGKERDTESGLDYFGARYYASSMGRFSSPDPSGLFFADPTFPQSLNLYSYARNNPLIGTDPTGMAYCQWDDGSHDDSANTGVDGAVNSGTECTNAGGTWSHDDGLNDDGTPTGSEYAPPALTVTATLVTSTDTTSVSTTGPIYDPDAARLYSLIEGIAIDTQSLPWLCNVSGYARAAIPKTGIAIGGSVDRTGAHGTLNAQLAPLPGGASLNYTQTGSKGGVQLNVPIPDTPFRGSVGVSKDRVNAGASTAVPGTKNAVSAGVSLSFGFLGDATCR